MTDKKRIGRNNSNYINNNIVNELNNLMKGRDCQMEF